MRQGYCGKCFWFSGCVNKSRLIYKQLEKITDFRKYHIKTYAGQMWMLFDGEQMSKALIQSDPKWFPPTMPDFFPYVEKRSEVQRLNCMNFFSTEVEEFCGLCRFYSHICKSKWGVTPSSLACTAQKKLGPGTYLNFNPSTPPKIIVPDPNTKSVGYSPRKSFHP